MITSTPPTDSDPVPTDGPGDTVPGDPGYEYPRGECFTPALLNAYRERIADLRASKCDLTASIMRDEVLSQIEAWIDPAGISYRATLQSIQGKQAAALALDICDVCGF